MWKIPWHGKRNSHPSPASAESPRQDRPKRNTARHIIINLTKMRQRKKKLKATMEKQQITYKGITIRLSADFSVEIMQASRKWHNIYFKWWKGRTYNQEYSTPSKALIQIQQRNQKVYRQAKANRIQHHQTSSATNAKGTSLTTFLETRELQMEKPIGKSKHTVEIRNHVHTNMVSKPARFYTLSWGEYKCRTLEMQLKLR